MNVRTLRLPSAQGDGLVAHLIGFDAATFHADDFGRLGIDCPDAVRRSATARQAEFLHGRLAARAGLAALDRGKEPVGIGTHREPVWPDGVVGSISHTRSLAAAAVARRERCAGVGIDLQELVSDAFASTLLRQALNPHEATRLREERLEQALLGRVGDGQRSSRAWGATSGSAPRS
jgi:enterobactin synthetase component D